MSRIATCVIISAPVPAVWTSPATTTITVMGTGMITGMTIMGTTTLMGMTTTITPILMRIIRSGRNRFATASRPDRTSNADQWNPI